MRLKRRNMLIRNEFSLCSVPSFTSRRSDENKKWLQLTEESSQESSMDDPVMSTKTASQMQEQDNRLLILALKLDRMHTQHVLSPQCARCQMVRGCVLGQVPVRVRLLPLARLDFVLVLGHQIQLGHLPLQQDRSLDLIELLLSWLCNIDLVGLLLGQDRGRHLSDGHAAQTLHASGVVFGVGECSGGGRGSHESQLLKPTVAPVSVGCNCCRGVFGDVDG